MLSTHQERINWILSRHTNTNHFYDEYLPYEFHLRMVVQVFKDFKHLMNESNEPLLSPYDLHEIIELACFAHDIMEDCRVSYNDCIKHLAIASQKDSSVADIVYACTNLKGKTRAERASDEYYKLIRETPGAVFVKLCDRIANVQYSKMTKSRMFETYKNECGGFLVKMGYTFIETHPYHEMFDYLISLFETEMVH